ncbi:MAG: PhzF family phenazine biosynthesis protein [Dehalococcoidia bacterium]|jgi:PhzF family phenazine biosynthesis protein
MNAFPFKKIDAFTRGESAGNPAGCIYLSKSGDISEEEMQQIARELKGFVNEVVYLFPEKDGIFFRYYSAECEVDFCGHGTIAAMYDYISTSPDVRCREVMEISVKNEYLQVYNRLGTDNCVYITAPEPKYHSLTLKAGEISAALGIDESYIAAASEPALINAGLNTLIVPIAGLSVCLAIKPDELKLKTFCLDYGIDIVLVFTQETAGKGHNYRTRVFAPKYGYLEDPATGSGNSALGYYLLRKGAWDGGSLTIEQNNSFERPNQVKLSTVEKEGKLRVIFGGVATVKIDGLYKLGTA